ncbi:MAG: Tuberous sclerosis 2-like protein [Caeruleum heppii]|nr:MAG: Tuberous sclerosis 2-like protein [Caeruleum heppii]
MDLLGKAGPSTPSPAVVQEGRMSPPSSDVPQTPESKPSGLTGVLKNLARTSRPSLQISPTANASLSSSAETPLTHILSKGAAAPIHDTYGGPADFDQLLAQIQPGQPLAERVAGAEALRHVIHDFSLSSLMGLWGAGKDLTDNELPNEARQAGFALLTACVQHSEPTPLERRQFFETLSVPCSPDDFHLQLSAVIELTKRGRDIDAFESAMMPVVVTWLSDWFKASAAARKKKKEKGLSTRAGGQLGEETNLKSVFGFVNDLIRFNYNAFQEDEILPLLDQILYICKKTTSGTDIENAVGIIDVLITYGDLPRVKLAPCLEVLCGAHSTLEDLVDPTWEAIHHLCRSHVAQSTIVALLNIVGGPSDQQDLNTNTVRGAVTVTNRVMKMHGSEGVPIIPLPLLLTAYRNSLEADSPRLGLEVADAVAGLFEDEQLKNTLSKEDDWSTLLEILSLCSRKTIASDPQATQDSSSSRTGKERELSTKLSETMTRILPELESLSAVSDCLHKEAIMDFFLTVPHLLPTTCVTTLVNYFKDEQLCYPSHLDYCHNIEQLINHFFADGRHPSSVRIAILQEIQEVYRLVNDSLPQRAVAGVVQPVLALLKREEDPEVLRLMISFAVDIAVRAEPLLFEMATQSMHRCVRAEVSQEWLPLTSPVTSPRSSRGTGSVASVSLAVAPVATVIGFVTVFLRCLRCSATKISHVFDVLLGVAQNRSGNVDARLAAMKLLFRLRSDADHAIWVTTSAGDANLAKILGRNTDDENAFPSSDDTALKRRSNPGESNSARSSRGTTGTPVAPLSRANTRTVSGTSTLLKAPTPLWSYPDSKALPEAPPHEVSWLARADFVAPTSSPSMGLTAEIVVLKLNVWLETIISIIQQGGDWEVYSYILVHLSPQLANKSLFVKAVPQIRTLRSVICEQLRANSVFEPPASSGVKKADVTCCLVQILTMLLPYHEHFSKNEQDEIVRTFLSGLGSYEKTSRCCVHALAICCHELPLSVSKSLNTILQKMAQIITQSFVAVHILEFLGGLSRIPEVYVNFREDDFRTVFGICFRYLQYARDQRQRGSGSHSTRTSYTSGRQSSGPRDSTVSGENLTHRAVDDLPQYVYALAYHVITFWFMSLKLSDRAKHVSWITKNLCAIDGSSREGLEEQSVVTLDMMQRVTYSDFDETIPDPAFASRPDGGIVKKRWIVGSSLLTVETMVVSGMSQLTKRQPSATTYTTYRSLPAPRPAHQIPLSSYTVTDTQDDGSRVAVLPNHILLQLLPANSKMQEPFRPIPLPDDEATGRAIRSFDRISTVDGHKVGVIYVGNEQSQEGIILANITGSSEYTEFLEGLGTLTRLKGAEFNTQGLDREFDTDGEYTFCWRDRVTEIVFHVATMMPTDLERDPQCSNKKRHTGNDFVNIIFNESGHAFRFDTFPSEFNYVNIVISPEARPSPFEQRSDDDLMSKAFFRVQVMSKPGFPEISPAAETKLVSGKRLAAVVRLLALNASVFSLVWANREGGEHLSSWRNRLREITRLRNKHTVSSTSTTSAPPTSSGSGTFGGGITGQIPRETLNMRRGSAATILSEGLASHRSSVLSTATTATEVERVEGAEVDHPADR